MTTTLDTDTNASDIIRSYMAANGRKGGSNGRGKAKSRDMKKIWKSRRANARRRYELEQAKAKEAANG